MRYNLVRLQWLQHSVHIQSLQGNFARHYAAPALVNLIEKAALTALLRLVLIARYLDFGLPSSKIIKTYSNY